MKDKFVIFGTGIIAQQYYTNLSEKYGEESIEFFIDSLLSVQSLFDKKVLHPSELNAATCNNYKYYLGSLTNTIGMRSELIKRGVRPSNIHSSNILSDELFMKNIGDISTILLYPKVEEDEWIQIKYKFDWYLTWLSKNSTKIKIISDVIKIDSKNYKVINTSKEEIDSIKNSDLILVWKKENIFDEILEQTKNIVCMDSSLISCLDIKTLNRINFKLLPSIYVQNAKKLFKKNFSELYDKYKNKKAFIFGTGPSVMQGITEMEKTPDFENSLRVACNWIIHSNDAMNKLNPNLYVIFDEKFLSEIYSNSIQLIIRYVENHDINLVIPWFWVPYILTKYPSIKNKIIGIDRDAKEITFPSENYLKVFSKAPNIITMLAIPVVSSISNEIYIGGCDGYENCDDKVKFLKHFGDLDKKAKEHDEFIVCGKNDGLMELYLKHCNFLEDIFQYGESLGKKYYSLTPSYILALKQRYIYSDGNK